MDERLQTFFEYIFGDCTGFLCIGNDVKKNFQGNKYFAYPTELEAAIRHIESKKILGNVWFCNQLLTDKTRSKSNVIDQATFLWADLDECPPNKMLIEPTIVIESSPKRYQGIWKLKEPGRTSHSRRTITQNIQPPQRRRCRQMLEPRKATTHPLHYQPQV